MKRILLAILFIFTTCVFSTFAVEKVKIGDLYYNLNPDDRTAEVTSQNNSYPYWTTNITTANIPASIEYHSTTYRVTSIGNDAFCTCKSLTSVTIPNSVTSIGKDAFEDCDSLTSVTIPNSVISIGAYAFYDCTGLTSITIPNSVTNIGWDALGWCFSLTSISVASGNSKYSSSNGVLFNYNKTTLIQYPAGKSGSYSIPNNVMSIRNAAFAGCRFLNSITIPNCVTSIGDDAFDRCDGLTSVTIPNSVTSIGNGAFDRCRGLTSISVASGNSKYSSSNGVLFDYNKTTLIRYPVGKSGSYSIPNSVTSIGKDAFWRCINLKEIRYPQGLDLSQARIPSTTKLIADSPTTTPTIPAKLPECRIDYSKPENIYHSSSIRLCYSVDSELSDNQEIEFLIDGTPVEPKTLSQQKEVRPVQCTEVELDNMPTIANHMTKVSIRIVDKRSRISWSEKSIALKYQSIHKPTLHVFAVGISEYDYTKTGLQKLQSGAKDAQDFVNTINSLDLSIYKEVKPIIILDKEATANNIRLRLKKLADNVDQEDVVMLFFSGHGMTEDNLFYFMTHGVRVNECVNALKFNDIVDQMQRMKNKDCHVFIFMDACHSGGMYGQAKGAKETISSAAPDIVGFYSSTADEQSRELNGNGLFTRALIDGLKGNGIANDNGQITIHSLRNYITNALNDAPQTPIFNTKGKDYILFYKKK